VESIFILFDLLGFMETKSFLVLDSMIEFKILLGGEGRGRAEDNRAVIPLLGTRRTSLQMSTHSLTTTTHTVHTLSLLLHTLLQCISTHSLTTTTHTVHTASVHSSYSHTPSVLLGELSHYYTHTTHPVTTIPHIPHTPPNTTTHALILI
jgi:hypothetical protein